jgi:hypothetical protein
MTPEVVAPSFGARRDPSPMQQRRHRPRPIARRVRGSAIAKVARSATSAVLQRAACFCCAVRAIERRAAGIRLGPARGHLSTPWPEACSVSPCTDTNVGARQQRNLFMKTVTTAKKAVKLTLTKDTVRDLTTKTGLKAGAKISVSFAIPKNGGACCI